MSKNVIFYFTGTGNSLKVAKDVAHVLGDCNVVSMPLVYTTHDEYNLFADVERIGFIYPVYGGPPNFVKKFVSELTLPKGKNIYYFVVVTCGIFKWKSISIIKDTLIEKGINLNAGFSIKMIANAIGLYNIADNVEKILKKAQVKINFVSEKIKSKKNNMIFDFDPLIALHDKFAKSLPTMDTNYNVSENCMGCKICSQVCPVKNIEIIHNKPVFKHTCEQCMACIHLCPSKAINYGNKTQNKKRYINPDITIKEIINGNNNVQEY
ncbi:MAG: EFR1 family ferrodoxin [Treponema sp.]|nr:EFR1 family ferrodoxin [Treponema sp.]